MSRTIPDACPKCGSDPDFRGTLGSSYTCGSWVKSDGSHSYTKTCHARDKAKGDFARRALLSSAIFWFGFLLTVAFINHVWPSLKGLVQ